MCHSYSQAQAAERRAAMVAGEVEDYKAQLEQLERSYKMAQGELNEASDRVNELSAQNSSLNAHKKRLETTVQQMQSDLEAQVGPHTGSCIFQWLPLVLLNPSEIGASCHQLILQPAKLLLGFSETKLRVYGG